VPDISEEAVEAVQQAVIEAMIEHGPDGHIDGYEEISRAALEAAAPHLQVCTGLHMVPAPEDDSGW
jgi:hypothetical protein